MAEVFNVSGKLGLNTSKFREKLDQSKKDLGSFQARAKKMSRDIKKSFKGVTKAASQITSKLKVMAAVATAGTIVAVKQQLSYQDALAKSADKIGANIKKLGGLRFAAEQVSGSYKGIDEALTKASKRLGEFNANGAGAAAKWLKKLNLDTAELAKLDPVDLFTKYSESISGLSTRAEKLAAASALMGDESRKFLTLMEQGPAAIKAFAKDADDLGVTITRIDAAKIEAANDAMNRVKTAGKGAATTLSIELAPILKEVSDRAVNFIKSLDLSKSNMMKGIRTVAKGFGILANGIHGVKVLLAGAKVAALGFTSLLTGGFNSLLQVMAGFGNGVKDFVLFPLKKMLELVSKLPFVGDKAKAALEGISGIEFKAPKIATEAFHSQLEALALAQDNLKAKLAEPLPSEGIESFLDEIEKAKIKVDKLNDEVKKTSISLRDFGGEFDNVAKQASDLSDNIKIEAFKKKFDDMGVAADNFGSQMRSTLGTEIEGIMDGNFKNIGDSFKQMLKSMVANAIAADIGNAIGLGGGGGAGSGAKGFFSGALGFATGLLGGKSSGVPSAPQGALAGAFPKQFAKGGNPDLNKTAIVGEKGPELFVPKQNGTVISNDKLGGMGGSTTVNNFTIVTSDADSFVSSKSRVTNFLSTVSR